MPIPDFHELMTSPDESADVLVERDGIYEWNTVGADGPAPLAPVGGQRRRRRGASTEAGEALQCIRRRLDMPR